ncbi:beta-parvin [Ictidomys tridecemlineatus]
MAPPRGDVSRTLPTRQHPWICARLRERRGVAGDNPPPPHPTLAGQGHQATRSKSVYSPRRLRRSRSHTQHQQVTPSSLASKRHPPAAIHGKNLVAILHLLIALATHFRAPIRLPEHVSVQVVVVRKREGLLHSSHVSEELTSTTEQMMGRFERDAFDTLFDHAPDKLNLVKKSLITFVNKQLNKLNLEVTELETQFADGVYLVLLMGLLEDYFVPLHNFYLTPESFDQKVHNVSFAFELMLDGGLRRPKARPEDVVNLDLKSTLRVLYNLFTKYKNVE